MNLKGRNFLKLMDYTPEEITYLIDLSAELKEKKKKGIRHDDLVGKNIALIFEKTSTRTRCSFEVAAHDMGMGTTYLDPSGSQIGKKESIEDTARVLSRYLDGIMIRTFEQSEVEALAEYGSIPIINGLTDFCHPCQVLADLMTVREHKGHLDGLKMCYIGDGNNMANSLIVGGLKTGMTVSVACPDGYKPDSRVLDFAEKHAEFSMFTEPMDSAEGADVIFTDVWASMGHEGESEQRKAVFGGKYQVNEKLLSAANSGCMVQHCLPAHRGEEITAEVFEAHANEIFDEAENRLHAQKAVMVALMEK